MRSILLSPSTLPTFFPIRNYLFGFSKEEGHNQTEEKWVLAERKKRKIIMEGETTCEGTITSDFRHMNPPVIHWSKDPTTWEWKDNLTLSLNRLKFQTVKTEAVAFMTFPTQLSDFLNGFIPNGDGAEDKMVPPTFQSLKFHALIIIIIGYNY